MQPSVKATTIQITYIFRPHSSQHSSNYSGHDISLLDECFSIRLKANHDMNSQYIMREALKNQNQFQLGQAHQNRAQMTHFWCLAEAHLSHGDFFRNKNWFPVWKSSLNPSAVIRRSGDSGGEHQKNGLYCLSLWKKSNSKYSSRDKIIFYALFLSAGTNTVCQRFAGRH